MDISRIDRVYFWDGMNYPTGTSAATSLFVGMALRSSSSIPDLLSRLESHRKQHPEWDDQQVILDTCEELAGEIRARTETLKEKALSSLDGRDSYEIVEKLNLSIARVSLDLASLLPELKSPDRSRVIQLL